MRHEIELTGIVINPLVNKWFCLESVKSEGNVRYPREGLTLLCGRRFSNASFSRLSGEASMRGDRLVAVKVTLQAVRPATSPHWFDTYEGKSVVDLHRLRPDVESELVKLWRKYMREDGYSEMMIREVPWERSQFIALYPHYLDRLKDEREFRNVDAFIWRTWEKGRVVARATLYRSRNVIGIKPICVESIRVALPVLQ